MNVGAAGNVERRVRLRETEGSAASTAHEMDVMDLKEANWLELEGDVLSGHDREVCERRGSAPRDGDAEGRRFRGSGGRAGTGMEQKELAMARHEANNHSPSGRGRWVTPKETQVTTSVSRMDRPPSWLIHPSSESRGASIVCVGNFPALSSEGSQLKFDARRK